MSQGFFITGTDTGVGKTRVSCLLLEFWRQQGLSVAAWKPVAAGAEWTADGWRNDDGRLLQLAQGGSQTYADINPICLAEACSPHLAASKAQQTVDVALLARHWSQFALPQADRIVVEGAGGWLTPLNERETLADLAQWLNFPVILVVSMRLGCLNQALLTAQAIRAMALPLYGWVANSVTAEMPFLAENLAYLTNHLQAPCLAQLPVNAALWEGCSV